MTDFLGQTSGRLTRVCVQYGGRVTYGVPGWGPHHTQVCLKLWAALFWDGGKEVPPWDVNLLKKSSLFLKALRCPMEACESAAVAFCSPKTGWHRCSLCLSGSKRDSSVGILARAAAYEGGPAQAACEHPRRRDRICWGDKEHARDLRTADRAGRSGGGREPCPNREATALPFWCDSR